MASTGPGTVDRTAATDRWQLFASDPHAPRTRRPIDWFFAAIGPLAIAFAGWASSTNPRLDQRVLEFFRSIPNWLDVLGTFGFALGGLYVLVLVVSVLTVGRGRRIARDLMVAIGLYTAAAFLVGRAVSGEWPDVFPEFLDVGERPTYPAARLALITMVVRTVAPHLTLPMRRVGRRMTTLVAVSGVVIGAADVTNTIGAIALGVWISSSTHAIFGSPAGIPPPDRVRSALTQLGIPVVSVELRREQPIGVALADAVGVDGREYLVKVHGRDAADAEMTQRVWRSMWYRGRSPGWSVTGVQQVEHEAVLHLMAERHGAPVPSLAAVGRDGSDNGLLVLDRTDGWPLADLPRSLDHTAPDAPEPGSSDQTAPDVSEPGSSDQTAPDVPEPGSSDQTAPDAPEPGSSDGDRVEAEVGPDRAAVDERGTASTGSPPTDEMVDAAWAALRSLHDAGLAHLALRPDVVVLTPDGGLVLEDLEDAVLSPSDHERCIDRVQLVATLMTVVGPERAAAGMQRALGTDELEAALPFLQEAVLTPELRRQLRPVGKLKAIADVLLENPELTEPEKAKIRRVRLGDLVLVAFGVLAVNAVLSQIAEIGFDVLWDELLSADLGWLVAAFLIGLSSAWGDVISLRGAVTVPVPTGPTMLLQTAKSFIGLTVPTMAGRVAMDVRYLQQLGVTTTVALAQGPLISFGGFLVEVVILLVSSWRIGQEFETSALGDKHLGAILVVVLIVIVIGLIVLAAVPKLRNKIVPSIKEALGSVSEVVTSPRRLGRILGGQLVIRLVNGLALAATLEAFGQEVPFAAAMFVAVGVGLLAGLAPVPGGVGVAEALLTSLLVAVGVPAESAFSAAITYRLLTSYLPPLIGWFSFGWLKREGYL